MQPAAPHTAGSVFSRARRLLVSRVSRFLPLFLAHGSGLEGDLPWDEPGQVHSNVRELSDGEHFSPELFLPLLFPPSPPLSFCFFSAFLSKKNVQNKIVAGKKVHSKLRVREEIQTTSTIELSARLR